MAETLEKLQEEGFEFSTNEEGLDPKHWCYPVMTVVRDWFSREGYILDESLFGYRLASIRPEDLNIQPKDGTLVFSPSAMEIMGYATLTNDSNEPQSLTTGAFSKTIETHWSTAATNTRNFGMELEYKAVIGPTFFKSEFRVQYNMSFSHSSTKTKGGSQSLTYSLPAQTITVPPRSTRYVYAYLEKSTASAQVNMLTDVGCIINATGKSRVTGQTLQKSGNAYVFAMEMFKHNTYPELREAVGKPNMVEFVGTGQFTLDAAFKVAVKISETPIQSGGNVLEEFSLVPDIEVND